MNRPLRTLLLDSRTETVEYDEAPDLALQLVGRRAQVTQVSPLQVRFQGEQIDVPVPLVNNTLTLSTTDTVLVVQLHGATWCAIAKLVAS